MRSFIRFLICASLVSVLASGCSTSNGGNGNASSNEVTTSTTVTYSPIKPLVIEYNLTSGVWSVALDESIQTPIGTFGIVQSASPKAGSAVDTADKTARPSELNKDTNVAQAERILVITDGTTTKVYEIKSGQPYDVKYKYGRSAGGEVEVEGKENGDIYVHLPPPESATPTPEPAPLSEEAEQHIDESISSALDQGKPTPYCMNSGKCRCYMRADGKVECECSPSSHDCGGGDGPVRERLRKK